MSEYELQFIEPDGQDWNTFIGQRPDSNIFHHPAWHQLLGKCYGYRPFAMVMRDPDGSIRAGLPFMEVNRPHRKRRWISLPFSDHCSPLTNEPEVLARLSTSLNTLSGEHGNPNIEVRWDLSGTPSEQDCMDYVLHVLSLDQDVEKVKSRIHHSHLRNVKAAQAHEIQIRRGVSERDLEAFYRLHLETRHRQGVPIQPRRYFKLLHEMILQPGLGFISLAYHGSECLAGAVFLHWNRTLTYKYGASTEAGLSLRPNHLIFWDAIRWGCEQGYSVLDFGRTDLENSGLRIFKSRWGAREIPLRYFNTPQPDPANGERAFMSAAQAVISRSPLWLCKLAGEIYYRFFA